MDVLLVRKPLASHSSPVWPMKTIQCSRLGLKPMGRVHRGRCQPNKRNNALRFTSRYSRSRWCDAVWRGSGQRQAAVAPHIASCEP